MSLFCPVDVLEQRRFGWFESAREWGVGRGAEVGEITGAAAFACLVKSSSRRLKVTCKARVRSRELCAVMLPGFSADGMSDRVSLSMSSSGIDDTSVEGSHLISCAVQSAFCVFLVVVWILDKQV